MDSHPAGLQMQLRQNNEELTDYLKGLDDWEEEMKEKDQSLSRNKSILKEVILSTIYITILIIHYYTNAEATSSTEW